MSLLKKVISITAKFERRLKYRKSNQKCAEKLNYLFREYIQHKPRSRDLCQLAKKAPELRYKIIEEITRRKSTAHLIVLHWDFPEEEILVDRLMEVEISQEYSLDLLKKETTPTRLRNHIARNRLKLNPCNSELSLIIDYVDSEKIKEEAGRQYLDSSNLGNGSLEFIASRVPGLKDEAESRLARDANSVLHDIHNVVAT